MGNARTSYEAIPIVDAARRCGVELDNRTLGREEVEAVCPFCGDKPRRRHLSLNTKKDQYYCHLCGASGNSVSLYARLQNISNREAAQELLDGRNNVYPLPRRPQPETPPERMPKPLCERHDVFYTMLSHLELSAKHRENLRERGLSDERIDRNMYRTLPGSERARLFLANMLADFYELDGIPGFYRNNMGNWTIDGKPGLLIPFRDRDGYIQGIQIRLDDETNPKRKYRWLASTRRKDGAKSGSWIHVTGDVSAKVAHITEGGLKGDVASFHDGEALFLCFAGVNAIDGLRETIESLDIEELVIAADMDKVTNWRVRNAFENIAKVVSKIPGVRVRAINWNPSHNGIDDYYMVRNRVQKGGKIIVMRQNNITAHLHALWKKEYPEQDAGFINVCEWEEKTVPLSSLEIDPPKNHLDLAKARKYKQQMEAGTVFPPLVCINGFVIDGFHRHWAYAQTGRELVTIYQNIPWEVGKAAA